MDRAARRWASRCRPQCIVGSIQNRLALEALKVGFSVEDVVRRRATFCGWPSGAIWVRNASDFWKSCSFSGTLNELRRRRCCLFVIECSRHPEDTGDVGGDAQVALKAVVRGQCLQALGVGSPFVGGKRLVADPVQVDATTRTYDGAERREPRLLGTERGLQSVLNRPYRVFLYRRRCRSRSPSRPAQH